MISETELRTSDSLRLYAWQRHPPAAPPKAVFALVHGMGEHSRRYDHLCGYWEARGYASAGFDLRGHGRSAGKRGHTPSYDALMDDIQLFLGTVAAAWPDVPIVLYGHSMGGNLVLNYAIRRAARHEPARDAAVPESARDAVHRGPALAAVVASAPYLRLAFEPPWWKVLASRILVRIAPALSLPTGADARWISRDPEVVARYESDPLVHDRITSAFYSHVHPAGASIIPRAFELTIPTLVMHGTADRLTSPAGSAAFVAASRGQATLRLWPDRFHEIHNDPGWEEVGEGVVGWVGGQRPFDVIGRRSG